jgi:glutamine amidotransferase PdxT
MDINIVTMRAEIKLRVLDNRVPRNLFGSKRQKVARKLEKIL